MRLFEIVLRLTQTGDGPCNSPPSQSTRSTSSPSRVKCRVEMLELDARVLGREAPVDAVSGGIAVGDPGGHFLLDSRPVGQPAVQALALQDTQLDLGHVEPTAMLGRVMDFQLVGQALRLGRWERL